MPRSAARNAAAYPPGPAPTTAMFRVVISDMSLSNHQEHESAKGAIQYDHSDFCLPS
jgi:hypothetical protein